MRYTIPTRSWTLMLWVAIAAAQDGDVIEVHNDAMQELAERARLRMCPDKNLTFEIEEEKCK